LSLLKCRRAKCDNDPRETVYFESVYSQQDVEVDACAQHIDSLRKFIPGFTAASPVLCIVKGCENKRRTLGCCDNHSKHIKKWGLQQLAKEYAEYSLQLAVESTVATVDTDNQTEGVTMPPSNCPDVTEASPVDVECQESNVLTEAWQKAKADPVDVIDERVAEIVRLEQENTALREQLAKVEKQTSTFVLDESDLRRRYHNMVMAEQTIRELDGGGYVTVMLNNTEVRTDEYVIQRIKYDLRQRAAKAIEDALQLNVTVPPKDALFYLVWSPDGRTPPRYKHSSLETAKNAANQMKSLHGGEFYAVAVIGDVSDNKDDIPF
jgi:hypothetical protein